MFISLTDMAMLNMETDLRITMLFLQLENYSGTSNLGAYRWSSWKPASQERYIACYIIVGFGLNAETLLLLQV
jgi:hypothetical protein